MKKISVGLKLRKKEKVFLGKLWGRKEEGIVERNGGRVRFEIVPLIRLEDGRMKDLLITRRYHW